MLKRKEKKPENQIIMETLNYVNDVFETHKPFLFNKYKGVIESVMMSCSKIEHIDVEDLKFTAVLDSSSRGEFFIGYDSILCEFIIYIPYTMFSKRYYNTYNVNPEYGRNIVLILALDSFYYYVTSNLIDEEIKFKDICKSLKMTNFNSYKIYNELNEVRYDILKSDLIKFEDKINLVLLVFTYLKKIDSDCPDELVTNYRILVHINKIDYLNHEGIYKLIYKMSYTKKHFINLKNNEIKNLTNYTPLINHIDDIKKKSEEFKKDLLKKYPNGVDNSVK